MINSLADLEDITLEETPLEKIKNIHILAK